jgi:hypothetical protein
MPPESFWSLTSADRDGSPGSSKQSQLSTEQQQMTRTHQQVQCETMDGAPVKDKVIPVELVATQTTGDRDSKLWTGMRTEHGKSLQLESKLLCHRHPKKVTRNGKISRQEANFEQ